MSLGIGLKNKIRRSRAGGAVPILLDQSFASGATAAYSLRRLKSTATKAVRVREDSGNTETDIGFSGGKLDETALLNHVGSNNGFVTKWYDQSGNGNNASNSTASEQPQIVSSGSVIKDNGEPAVDFDGSDDFLNASFNLSEPFSTISVFSIDVVSRNNSIFGSSSSLSGMFQDDNSKIQYFNGSGIVGPEQVDKQELVTHGQQSPNTFFRQNGKNIALNADNGSNSIDGFSIGLTTFRQNGNIKMTELIIYDRVNKTEIIEIETNINNYYSIF